MFDGGCSEGNRNCQIFGHQDSISAYIKGFVSDGRTDEFNDRVIIVSRPFGTFRIQFFTNKWLTECGGGQNAKKKEMFKSPSKVVAELEANKIK